MSLPHWDLAPLEKLPIELLQRIFFDSLEFNLPRASLAIARSLSGSVVYTWLVRLAFSSGNTSSDQALFVVPFLPLDYFALADDQRTALQTQVLRCRWCTAALVRRCQREYIEYVLARKGAHLHMADEDAVRLSNALEHAWNTISAFELHDPSARGNRGDLVIPAVLRTRNNDGSGSGGEDDAERRNLAIWFNLGAVQIRKPRAIVQQTDLFRLPCSNVSVPCRMPDRLLRAPWTPDKLELLALLATEAYIDEDDRFERSKAVLRQLIIDRNFRVFEKLLAIQIRVKEYAYPLRWPVKPNHFRLAARCAESDDNDRFLRTLFVRRKESIPSNDSSVRALMQRYERRDV